MIEAQVAPFAEALPFAKATSEACAQKMMDFQCSRAFPRCDDGAVNRAVPPIPVPVPVPFPELVCNDLCLEYKSECGAILDNVPQLAGLDVDCSAAGTLVPTLVDCDGPIDGYPIADYPDDGTIFAVFSGQPVSTECSLGVNRTLPTAAIPDTSCEELSPFSVCAGVLDYTSVFVPPGYCDQTQLEAEVRVRAGVCTCV